MESSEHELLLPPVKEENICLPLSINAVAKYWNVDLPIEEAKDISKKYPNVNGSILIEGVELAERHGLNARIIHDDLDGLKRFIDMGIPPIVIMPGLQNVVQHASVISGYDDEEKSIFHYIPSPTTEGEFQVGVIPESKFDSLWQEDGRLMILLAPNEITLKIKINEDHEKSNRLCFVSERQNLQKKPEEAKKSLDSALGLNPKNSTALSLLGGILNEAGSEECVKYYQKAIDNNKRCYLAFRGLGNYYLKKQDYKKAEEYYTNAIKINPTRFAPIHKNRGITRLQQKKNKEAKGDFEEYLKLMPDARDRDSITDAIKEL
ncbi:MAG: tetratricopeptide repeat protein [Nitrosopumilaceae archaeon]|nr:tetratricopeptide repeat protein [Nitrosopumilaceae archaeon]NIU00274.1 tetratricopeptide repeat protein [Nitrosopumilaceae archaeon]NIU86686.1 tetratricopeptide repeat protein [Nitrosopumilaceae archaeon]NIV65381.1 tetratricopeptide repeat protein [Nitrosopumilaceae archaeon]NIX60876.1 tetratricopeptide repeat protein [Nitrosopumilaceae archaeon]